MQPTTTKDAVGVQQLIDKLKSEGVDEGKHEAETLLAEAKKQAGDIVDAARDEAEKILRDAQQQAERTETNGNRALALASRDTSLQLKEQLEHEFRSWIGKLVHEQLDKPEFLGQVILEMARQVISEVGGGQVNAPEGRPSVDFLAADGIADEVDAFVKSQAAEMVRAGVTVQADRTTAHGFRAQLAGKDIEIDFTDETVTAALMRFLAPKFRQLIGAVQARETE